ncbi:MAG: aliphatic sulfonate ABC transporter substrate-binding protein [Amaricoccus sp.]
MITRRRFAALAGTALVAGLAAPSILRAKTKELRIGWQKNGVLALAKSQQALEKRFADRGLAISWAEFSSGPPLLEALGAGALDFGPTGDVPPLFAQAAGGNLLYVGTYTGSPAGSAILVHKDAPIQTIADLKGKTLAFKRGSSAHNFVVKALRSAGLTPDDVKAADLAPPDALAAFRSGAIDAWAIWDPYFAVAEADPATRVLTTAEGIVPSWSYFLGNGDFTKGNPDLVLDILNELATVGKAAQGNLDVTVPALSAITGVPEATTRVVLTRPGFDLGHVGPVGAEAQAYQQALADEFHGLGILPKALTISDIVWQPKAS